MRLTNLSRHRFLRAPGAATGAAFRAVARAGAAPAETVPPPDPADPLHNPTLELRDEAVFLLHAAAEVEHALLAQYLYAAYSLRVSYEGSDRPDKLDRWHAILLQIAREEMAHLLTVQNLLRLIGGPLNFEREDFPFRSAIYPFHFQLEPLTKGSLSKYVYAEMPGTITDDDPLPEEIAEIQKRARKANGNQELIHVGWLYARLQWVFEELPPTAFRLNTTDFWARKSDWVGGPADLRPRLLVLPEVPAEITANSVQAAAVQAVRAVGEQGEGQGHPSDAEKSHYELFREIYDEFPFRADDDNEPFPAWMVPLPINPNTIPAGEEVPAELVQGQINDPRTRAWAQLFNLRYRLLLSYLEHFLLLDLKLEIDNKPSVRRRLKEWIFTEMPLLSRIAERMSQLPEVSGPPFELPYTLNLPDRDADRWLGYIDVTLAVEKHITEMKKRAEDQNDSILNGLLTSDNRARQIMQAAAEGQTVVHSGPTPQDRMIELIRAKIVQGAPGFHGHITFEGMDRSLRELFDTSLSGNTNFELLLGALTTKKSVRVAPGEDLVVAGQPEQSVLYRILTENLRPAMAARFTPAEREVVREWIVSLAPAPAALSFANDIRPLFRQFDIDSMKDERNFDLSNYDDVKPWADRIHERLSDKTMPCDAPWSDADVAKFRQWIDSGMKP